MGTISTVDPIGYRCGDIHWMGNHKGANSKRLGGKENEIHGKILQRNSDHQRSSDKQPFTLRDQWGKDCVWTADRITELMVG